MKLLTARRFAFTGQGQTVINAVAVASGLGMLWLGYDQGVMAGLIGAEGTPFSNTFKNPNAASLGLMVAIYEIGCFFGAMFAFMRGDYYSRRTCMVLGVIVMAVGATIQTTAYTMGQLIAGRVITGLGDGLNFSTIPNWASEISGHDERGRIAAFNGWLIIWGVVIAYWVGYACADYMTDMQFRFPIALQILFGLLMAFMVVFLPESPRWLIAQGRDEEAKAVLDWITPIPENAEEPHEVTISNLCSTIIHAREVEKSAEGDVSFAELLHGGKMQNWRRMCLCIGIMAFQQLSGINLLTYYISYVLENSVGLDRKLSLMIGGFNGIEYLFAAMIPMWTIEKIGRRKLLLISAAAMGIVAVACFFLFNTFYAQGFLAIPFFYPAEITNLRTRSRGVSLSVMSNWIFTFLVVMITPVATTSISWRTYVIFAVLNASFIPMIYFFLPETTGLSLEALDNIFNCGGITRGVMNKQHRKRMIEISSQLDDNTDVKDHTVVNEEVKAQTSTKDDDGCFVLVVDEHGNCLVGVSEVALATAGDAFKKFVFAKE
ncbi:hypothetical protein C7974DRAFT_433089 [Boeremia exigua]|uniref:uncharacterized protein n=1 Tax=Boeremia exigua TaxID=749465 RepID=UPI001E8E95D0|nr:uncharacterized protein C7974DRAFT_433089 [Boeremia exigua]KAH6638491.1 hypothetical protein C7974DRAFT_433089 [Boeremia exigua]